MEEEKKLLLEKNDLLSDKCDDLQKNFLKNFRKETLFLKKNDDLQKENDNLQARVTTAKI